MVESDNSLRLYLEFEEQIVPRTVQYALDGKAISLDHSDNGYYLELSNVPAKKLGEEHTFTITDGTNTYYYTASVLTYSRSSVKNGEEARKNLGRALYLYYLAAQDYFRDN